MARILLIEDETYMMAGIVNCLRRAGHDLHVAETGAQGLAFLRLNGAQYDLVILDLMLPHGCPASEEDRVPQMEPENVGAFLLQSIARRWAHLPVFVLTAVRSDLDGLTTPARCKLFPKPVIAQDLLGSIDEELG